MVFVKTNVLQVFKKCQTAALQNSARAEYLPCLKRETKKQSKLPGNSSLLMVLLFLSLEKALSCFSRVKSSLFFKFIYK